MNPEKWKQIVVLLITLGCLAACSWFLFFWSPQPNWEVSADERVLYIELMAEHDLNYIPPVQIWGDGQIQWIEYDSEHNRRVLRGQLTQIQLRSIIERLIQAGWFRNVHRLTDKDYALDYLTVNLNQVTESRLVDPEDKTSYEIIQFIRNGAGVKGSEFIPECGSLILFPVEETSYAGKEIFYEKWPSELYGQDIEGYRNLPAKEKVLTGSQLHFAWKAVNRQHPFVAFKGQVYYLAVDYDTCKKK